MIKEIIPEKSTLVQIMNEVDELTDAEKSFVLYWLRVKKNSSEAAIADRTVMPSPIEVPAPSLKEDGAMHKNT